MISVMSSVGKPTEVSTITMVTSPACGIPAAPMLAAVAVMLEERVYSFREVNAPPLHPRWRDEEPVVVRSHL